MLRAVAAYRTALVVVVAFNVAACGIARRREMEAKVEALKAQSNAAAQQCLATYPAGTPKIAVARMKCLNDALLILRPLEPFPDLLDLLVTSRAEIAEEYQDGKLTQAQASEKLAEKQSEIAAEEQRRSLANRAVVAQEGMAAASLSAAGPHSCTRFGNTVSCF